MNENNKAKGFYLILLSAVLAAVSVALYTQVLLTTPMAYVWLVVGIICGVATLVASKMTDKKALLNWGTVVMAVCVILGLAQATTSMVYPIGYVISGLYQFSSIQSYIVFMVVGSVAWLSSVFAGFLGVMK